MAYYGRGGNRKFKSSPGENNEHPHGKPFFYLPKVLLNRDRYCCYCGKQVKEEWKFCRDCKCQRSTTPEYPQVGPDWSLCPKCKLSYLQAKTRFCSICHYRTRAGDVWQVKATKLHRKVSEAFEKFRKEAEVDESDLFDDNCLKKKCLWMMTVNRRRIMEREKSRILECKVMESNNNCYLMQLFSYKIFN